MTHISFTNRSDEQISEDFKTVVENKILSIVKLDPEIKSIDVVFNSSSNPSRGDDSHRIDIIAHGQGRPYSATYRSYDFESAIDECVEKLRRQLKKTKDSRTVSKSGHRRPSSYGDVLE